MKRRLTILTLTTLAAVAIIGVVSTAPSPAFAGGATQISGVGFLTMHDVCDPESVDADYALVMTGDLEGCLYTFVETAQKLAQRDLPRDGNRDSSLARTGETRYVQNDLPIRGEVRGCGQPGWRDLWALSTSYCRGQRHRCFRGCQRAT